MGRTRSMSSALMAAVTACAVLGGEVLRLSHPCFVLAAGVSAGVVGCWRSASSAGEPLTMHSTEHAARHPQLCTGSQVPPCRSCEMLPLFAVLTLGAAPATQNLQASHLYPLLTGTPTELHRHPGRAHSSAHRAGQGQAHGDSRARHSGWPIQRQPDSHHDPVPARQEAAGRYEQAKKRAWVLRCCSRPGRPRRLE